MKRISPNCIVLFEFPSLENFVDYVFRGILTPKYTCPLLDDPSFKLGLWTDLQLLYNIISKLKTTTKDFIKKDKENYNTSDFANIIGSTLLNCNVDNHDIYLILNRLRKYNIIFNFTSKLAFAIRDNKYYIITKDKFEKEYENVIRINKLIERRNLK